MAYLVEFFESWGREEATEPYWRGLFNDLELVAKHVSSWVRFKQRQHHKKEVATGGQGAEPTRPALYMTTLEELLELFKAWPNDTKELYSHHYYRDGVWGSSLKVTIAWVGWIDDERDVSSSGED